MMIRTHLAITLFLVLLFVPIVRYPILFLVVAMLATYLPDIDSKHSKIGHHWFLRPIQWFSSHRGFVHSFSFLILVTLGFVLFLPMFALAFFLGYCSHLIADSFTVEGIRPFYPSHKLACGSVRTGSVIETNILLVFLMIDLMLFISRSSIIF